MNRHYPRTGRCEHCKHTDKPTEYASIGDTYTHNREDWLELCKGCHMAFDGGQGNAAKQRAKTHCIHGHPFDEENTYWRPGGTRGCRKCKAEALRRHRARAASS